MDLKNMLKSANIKKESKQTHQLYTVWGENLNPDQVLPEYPRPQLKRENYTILNGYWGCEFTGAEDEKPVIGDQLIVVPFSPESVLSGVNRQLMPDEALWYERAFWMGPFDQERILLHFGAVDQSCIVYINDKEAGRHLGGYLSFDLDITEFVEQGENLLTVKVRDVSDTSYHSRGKQRLKSGGIFYTAQSGIWQTVWLERVPLNYVRNLWITPRYDEESVEIDLEVSKNVSGAVGAKTIEVPVYPIRVEVRAKNQVIFAGEFDEDKFVIPVKDRISWSPENPFLYDLTVIMGKDRVESYFAMRTFTKEVDEQGIPRLCLNHEPYFLNGVLDQGYWPDGLMTAPSDEALIYDIEAMKSLGFNMLRKHCKLEPMRWYYHCDRLGMVVWQDMLNGGTDYHLWAVTYLPTVLPKLRIKDNHYRLFSRQDVEGREEWRRECEATVRQLYNCPCIGAWVVFNEAWGQFDANAGTELVRSLDSTRPIDQASGWYDQKGGEIYSVHNYFRKQKVERDKYGRAFVISEYGGYAWCVPGHSFSEGVFGYRNYNGQDSLDAGYRKLLDTELFPLVEKGLSAAVYTQVSDIEEEVNGLMTYDRKVVKVRR